MRWQEKGLILKTQKHGENGILITSFCFNQGKKFAFARVSSKNRALWQVGNLLSIEWNGRQNNQLGVFNAEMVSPFFAKSIASRIKNLALSNCCALLDIFLYQDYVNNYLLDLTLFYLEDIMSCENDLYIMKKVCLFELDILFELGYGLDLNSCALTGEKNNLGYISPNTGRVCTVQAGEKWKNKLFALPKFFLDNNINVVANDIYLGFEILNFFINKVSIELLGKSLLINGRDELQKLLK